MPSIDATLKGESANSYVTIDEVDEFLDNRYGVDDWFEIRDDDKARLIITATNILDELPYLYESFTTTQSLIFPVSIENVESGMVDIKKATILQTYYYFQNIETIEDAVNENLNNIKTQNLGSVQITKSIVGMNPFAQYEGRALKVLSSYLDLSNRRITDSTWTMRHLNNWQIPLM